MVEQGANATKQVHEFVGGPLCGSFEMTGDESWVKRSGIILTDEDNRRLTVNGTYVYHRRGDKYYHAATEHTGVKS